MEFGAWRKPPSPSRQLRVLQPQADSLHLQLLPELMGKLPFCFFFIRDFSFLKRGQGETTGRTSQEQRV